jgi:hypothetical protein
LGAELSRSASDGVEVLEGTTRKGFPIATPDTKELNMQVDLPKPIAAYFTADHGDGDAVSRCFTEDAVVKDEGHTHRGRAAIKTWKTNGSAKYAYTSEPIACEEKDGKTIVTSHLVGNFPGSPVDLRYFFKFTEDKIASLEIIP